jgi:cyclic-di-AMP phosphodiesterase PgpH
MNIFLGLIERMKKNGALLDRAFASMGIAGVVKRAKAAGSLVPPPLAILLYVIACIALFFPYSSGTISFDLPREGQIATETIVAPFTFDVIKTPEELARERQEASGRVLALLEYDAEAAKQVRRTLTELRTLFYSLAASRLADTAAAPQLVSLLGRQLSAASVKTLKKAPHLIDDVIDEAQRVLDKGICGTLFVKSEEKRAELQAQYKTSFDAYLLYDKDFVTLRKYGAEATVRGLDIPVKEQALESMVKRLRENTRNDAGALNAVYELFCAVVKPTVSYNEQETAKRRQRAAEDVLPIKGKVIEETEIVRKHQVVTADIVERLYSLRVTQERLDNMAGPKRAQAANVGRLLLVLISLVLLASYVRRFHRSSLTKNIHSLALATIVIFQIIIIRLSLYAMPRLFESLSDSSPLVPEYVIPVTVGPMLAAILFDVRMSFIVSLFVAIFFGCSVGLNFPLFLLSLVAGTVAGYSTKNIRYRWDFMKAIVPLMLVYALFILILQVMGYRLGLVTLAQNWGLAFVNCIVSSFLVMVSAMVFESLFGIATNMTLIELSDMNNPVLKRLSIEAAGTYNHSVLVGNLAESAAEQIGANALLARVASYYHDIGKIEKADYFIENSGHNDKSRHTKLAPTMSALIISSHVKEGVELARRQNLPKVIQDSILQHHGTTTVSYFYEPARQLDPHHQVQEETFRYPGPIPQTRENAIIMLADAVEAASRSLATSSPKLLRELVKKIIRDKFMSGQLDQCGLTLRDLDKIVDGFMPILQGMFHSRDPQSKEKKK